MWESERWGESVSVGERVWERERVIVGERLWERESECGGE